jgi:hypothetical protein
VQRAVRSTERSEPRNVAARRAGPEKRKQGSPNLQKVDYLYDASTGSEPSVETNRNMHKPIDIAAGNTLPPVGARWGRSLPQKQKTPPLAGVSDAMRINSRSLTCENSDEWCR